MHSLVALGMLVVVFLTYVRISSSMKSLFALCLVVPYVITMIVLVQMAPGDARLAIVSVNVCRSPRSRRGLNRTCFENIGRPNDPGG